MNLFRLLRLWLLESRAEMLRQEAAYHESVATTCAIESLETERLATVTRMEIEPPKRRPT